MPSLLVKLRVVTLLVVTVKAAPGSSLTVASALIRAAMAGSRRSLMVRDGPGVQGMTGSVRAWRGSPGR
jgi:hypothetical protein